MSVGAYSARHSNRETDAMVMRHAELVKRIAYHLAGRLPASVEVSDLIQAGMLGLLEAASNYTADRGASFETYAGIRIRGAMLDALRKLDWAPRSVHRAGSGPGAAHETRCDASAAQSGSARLSAAQRSDAHPGTWLEKPPATNSSGAAIDTTVPPFPTSMRRSSAKSC